MEKLFVRNIREVLRNKKELEQNLGVRVSIRGNFVTIQGSGLDEYEAEQVFSAVSFGFSVRRALVLKDEDYVFRKVHIKEHTKRDLRAVKARLIGTRGKTRKTFSEIADCDVLVGEGDVGIIGRAEDVDSVEQAVINVIKGSKQGNMYRYLEKMNRLKKDEDFNLE